MTQNIEIKNAANARGAWMVSFATKGGDPEAGDALIDGYGQIWRFRGYTFSPAGASGLGLFWAILEPPHSDSNIKEGDILRFNQPN